MLIPTMSGKHLAQAQKPFTLDASPKAQHDFFYAFLMIA
jgi:hypothetical protein